MTNCVILELSHALLYCMHHTWLLADNCDYQVTAYVSSHGTIPQLFTTVRTLLAIACS